MGNFFKDVGWILLGVLCALIALVIIYFAFINLVSSSWGLAIFLFLIGTIFVVMSIVAFRRATRQTSP